MGQGNMHQLDDREVREGGIPKMVAPPLAFYGEEQTARTESDAEELGLIVWPGGAGTLDVVQAYQVEAR